MKMLFIDAEKRQVREIDEKPELKTFYKYIGCNLIDAVRFENGDAGYIDDEGLLKDPEHFILFNGGNSPLAGNMVIVGTDEEGEDKIPKTTMKWVLDNVYFLNRKEIVLAVNFAKILERGLQEE